MKRFYDKKNNRLVYIGESSDSNFWDRHWSKNTFDKIYNSAFSPFDYVIANTKKYLAAKSKIIEGGCGLGQQVLKLQNLNYEIIGIDYAKKTVQLVNKLKPEINIKLGDVRKLDFADNYFDGYWSFGVIEHFYNGFDEILLEMKRILKKDGFLFVTFPHMSKLRKMKANRNKYPVWENDSELIKQFYQFALDEEQIISKFNENGFTLIKKQHLDGVKGLKDESKRLKKILQKIYNSKSFFSKIVAKIISVLFNPFSSHSILLVLKNK